MWCEVCAEITECVSRTYRISKDGYETIIERCGNCMSLQYIEYENISKEKPNE